MSQHVRDMLDGAEYATPGSAMRWIPTEGDRWAANPRPPARTPVTLVVDEMAAFDAVGPAGRVSDHTPLVRAWDVDAGMATASQVREALTRSFHVPIELSRPVVSPSFAQRLEAAWPVFQASIQQFVDAAAETIQRLQELAERLASSPPPRDDVRAHALWAAQHRNTGPGTVPAAQARRPRTHGHSAQDRPPPRRARSRRRA